MDQATDNPSSSESIDDLLARINGLAGGGAPVVAPLGDPDDPSPEQRAKPLVDESAESVDERAASDPNTFWPNEPTSLAEAKVSGATVEELILKYLLARGEASIREVATQVAMPFAIIEEIIVRLKQEQLLGFIDSQMNDYICKLTDEGRDRGRRCSDFCSYFGATPVAFGDYVDSVNAQTINNQSPSEEDLSRAFSDLLIDPK